MTPDNKPLLVAKLIKNDSTEEDILPKNALNFTLKELYEVIGCELIQVVPIKPRSYMIMDEEGKLKPNAQVNVRATQVFINNGYVGNHVVGTVIICPKLMFK